MDVKKVSISNIYCLLRRFNYDSVYERLKTVLPEEDFIFAERRVGAGFYVWKEEQEGWKPLGESDPLEWNLLREASGKKIAAVREALRGTMFNDSAEQIVTIPNESYIYYRVKEDGTYAFLLTAWGFRYPGNVDVELPPWGKLPPQKPEIRVGFRKNGNLLPHYEFALLLHSQKKLYVTDEQGYYNFGKIDLIQTYVLSADGTTYEWIPELGKNDYVFDVPEPQPEWCRIGVLVKEDGLPLAGEACYICYDGEEQTLSTDADGRISLKVTYKEGACCDVSVRDKTQTQPYALPGMNFTFDLEKVVEQPPVQTKIQVMAVKNGQPANGIVCTLLYDGHEYHGVTDAEGHFTQEVGYKEALSCLVKLTDAEEMAQEKELQVPVTEFRFEWDVKQPPVEFAPYVKVVGLDGFIGVSYPIEVEHAGIRTKYITDSEGRVKLPLMSEGTDMTVYDGYGAAQPQAYSLDSKQEEYLYNVPFSPGDIDNDVKVTVLDAENTPFVNAPILFRQAGHIDLLCTLNAEGYTCFGKDDFEIGKPIEVQLTISGKEFEPISFELEENEKEYVLQVLGKQSRWLTRFVEVLIAFGIFTALRVVLGLFLRFVIAR